MCSSPPANYSIKLFTTLKKSVVLPGTYVHIAMVRLDVLCMIEALMFALSIARGALDKIRRICARRVHESFQYS